MASGWVTALLAAALSASGIAQTELPQAQVEAAAKARSARPVCVGANLQGRVTLHASASGNNHLNFCDGRTLPAAATSIGEPLTLASGDFDEDGVPDLVSGFRNGHGGVLTVHRGNVNALWPYGEALRNGTPAAFLPNPRSFSVPEAPDFLVAGDFDADGHWDLLTAQRGSHALFLLRGNGNGGFFPAERIEIAGNVTQMIAGEINRPDGLIDIVVAVDTGAGSKALVYESPRGAMRGEPEIIALPQSATGLALGRFDGEALHDLVIAAGTQLVVVHGRDRRLSTAEAGSVAPARVTMQGLDFAISALVGGDFTGTGPAVAALDGHGVVHVLEHAIAPDSMLAHAAQSVPSMLPAGAEPGTFASGGAMSPVMAAQMAAVRQTVLDAPTSEWAEKQTVPLPSGFAQSVPRLIAAQVSGAHETDLLVPDSGAKKLHVLSRVAEQVQMNAAVRKVEDASPYVAAPMRVLSSLAAETEPVAVLPMRLNQHGVQGLVTLHAGDSAPVVAPQDVPPAAVFVVTNTSDTSIPKGAGPAGSLRAAMQTTNGVSGLSSIVFNIPTTDPGYNPATGVFTIKPYSENVPNSLDNFALPPINATVTIDGYTQPEPAPTPSLWGIMRSYLFKLTAAMQVLRAAMGLSLMTT